ncbi:MAG: FAD-dependent oxidoreductase, partial [Chthoniobacterales bacterium]
RSAREHDLPIECLTRQQITARYPTLKVREHEMGVFEPDGGVLDPERAIQAHLSLAVRHGAHARFEVAMESWTSANGGFDLHFSDGTRASARALVLTLGPWLKETLAPLGVPLRVQRNIQAWFSPATDAYHASRFPAFLLDRPEFPAPLYGFPDFGDGIKIAFHGHGVLT